LTQPVLPGSLSCVQLELSDPEQRWICQEVLHLGAEEPGENMGECMYEGVDYTITKAWLSDCPRKGLLQVYYNREARIIRKIREQGAWDHDKSVRGVGQAARRAGMEQVAFVCHCVLRALLQVPNLRGPLSMCSVYAHNVVSSFYLLQVFYKDGSVTNNNQVTFPDSSFECGDNPIFMPTWLMKYSKDSQGTKVLHKLVIV